MNFSNMIYLCLWVAIYYFTLLIVAFALNLLQNISIFVPFWNSWPQETTWLINIFLFIVIPLVGIAYAILSSSPQQQIVVQQ